jgi:hypothetical protein
MANGHGGFRPGGGRPRKVDEARVRDLAVKAIIDKYGSEDAGFQALLDSGESALVKWVYEHGYGKPTERVDITSDQPLLPTFIVKIDRPDTDIGNSGL